MTEVLDRFNHTVLGEFNIAPSADLSGADLRHADLSDADLINADLRHADLRHADLSDANLSDANLSDADLRHADLRHANLRRADLSDADLSGADLRHANLRHANLRRADLSGAVGILRAGQWLEDNFESDDHGYIVFKVLGLIYKRPGSWTIGPGAILTETVNPDRGTDCGSGINFGTWEWCRREARGKEIWRARIPWRALSDVVVPFGTDGKARCGELELIDIFKGGEDD